MKIFINTLRILVGILFIFSGLVKANDPLGLSYKMQEFFEVWNFHFLNSYTLSFSITIITFEILAGATLLLGWKKRLLLWLLLLLTIFFTFLTSYALFSGKIKTCGCFGDCIPLTTQQSFIKDVVLLICVSFLFLCQKHIKPICKPLINLIALIFIAASTIFLQWYVLQHLPIIDCLPYKKGNHLLALMQPPSGSISDSSVITFVYTKNGKQIEFTADQFPKDFNDSLYHFEKRYDKVVRKGNAEPIIHDFALISRYDGSDSTKAILNYKGNLLILFANDERIINDWGNNIKELNDLTAGRSNWKFIIATSNAEIADIIQYKLHLSTSIFGCDATAVKTIARADPTIYLLGQGTVIDKWGYADFDKVIKDIKTRIRQIHLKN